MKTNMYNVHLTYIQVIVCRKLNLKKKKSIQVYTHTFLKHFRTIKSKIFFFVNVDNTINLVFKTFRKINEQVKEKERRKKNTK